MPRYWFTTHWPKFEGGRDTLHVYVKDTSFAPNLATGDRVLIYEFLGGPSLLLLNGRVIRREPGKGGIVCDALIVSGFEERPAADAIERYTNGKTANWRYIARTDDRRPCFVAREKVNELLGYEPGYTLYGFNAGRGIIELKAEQYKALVAASGGLT